METDAGQIRLEMFETDAPNTVANFVKLAKEGFYDGLAFYRVIRLHGAGRLSQFP